jgi:hypothetical protein
MIWFFWVILMAVIEKIMSVFELAVSYIYSFREDEIIKFEQFIDE